jgi:YD repeat-containing protein
MRRRASLPQAVAAENPLAETAYFEYDANGNRVALVGPLGEAAYYGYDELDRLVSLRADALGLDAATYYSYDAFGRRTALTDAELHTTSFAYDALGSLLSEEDAIQPTTKVPGTLKRHKCLPCEALQRRRSFRSPWAGRASFPLRCYLHDFEAGRSRDGG